MTRIILSVLLETSLRVAVLAVLVGAVLLVIRVRATTVRHAAWTAVLCAMLAMPVLPALVPSVSVPIPPVSSAIDQIAQSSIRNAVNPPVESITIAPRRADPIVRTPSGDIVIAGSTAARSSLPWRTVALGLYGVGVLLLLVRLGIGVSRISRLIHNATPVKIPDSTARRILTSPAVSIPVTVGILRPHVVLPRDWPAWSPETRAAVLAHEQSHIVRRDPLVLFLAHLNRCLFWFHPLAWWLERQLSLTAELACDAVGVQAIGDARQYAEILVKMADAIRHRQGRVVWAGVGIDGSRLLGHRIDSVLSGHVFRETSRMRKGAVALGCAAAIVIAVACRERLAAAPLKADPEVASNIQRERGLRDFHNAAVGLSRQQAADLEAAIRTSPDDLEARRRLITFYQWSGQKVLGWNEMVAARRPHVLWMIEQHPEDELSIARGLTPALDRVGYTEAKKLWLVQLDKPGLNDTAVSNGVFFLRVSDKPIAEQVLLKRRARDPNGPTPRVHDGIGELSWVHQLGIVYALALLGSNDDTLGNVVKSMSQAEAHNAFAQHARQVLDESRDPALLYAAGSYLTLNARQAHVDFDHTALGRSYLERATQLDLSSSASTLLLDLHVADRNRRVRETVQSRELDLIGGEVARRAHAGERLSRQEQTALKSFEYRAVSDLSDADRFVYLAWLADESYLYAESVDYHSHEVARAKAAWALSKQYARDLLALAPRFKTDPHYGDAIFEGSMVLGMHALREGDVKAAVHYLEEATRAPSMSPETAFMPSLVHRLVNYLLKAGERDSVAGFLESAARIDAARSERFLTDAIAIRAGRMPLSYQYLVTPR
jgi:beta-lactamase regulating signal transducer with metallopeptidase domain